MFLKVEGTVTAQAKIGGDISNPSHPQITHPQIKFAL